LPSPFEAGGRACIVLGVEGSLAASELDLDIRRLRPTGVAGEQQKRAQKGRRQSA